MNAIRWTNLAAMLTAALLQLGAVTCGVILGQDAAYTLGTFAPLEVAGVAMFLASGVAACVASYCVVYDSE